MPRVFSRFPLAPASTWTRRARSPASRAVAAWSETGKVLVNHSATAGWKRSRAERRDMEES